MPDLLPPLPENWDRALCVAAHPDDLEYGTAAAVARWTSQGKTVTYLLATRGEAGIDSMSPAEAAPLREQEERDGALAVGVEVVEFLDYGDGVVTYGLELRRDIAREIRRRRPEVVVTGGFGERMVGGMTNQADHRAVGLATLDAARDAGNRWIFPELSDEGLDPWPGVRYVCVSASPIPDHGVDVTNFVHLGVDSLRAHKAYIDGLGDGAFDPDPFLRWLASQGGKAMGVQYGLPLEVHMLASEGPPPWETG